MIEIIICYRYNSDNVNSWDYIIVELPEYSSRGLIDKLNELGMSRWQVETAHMFFLGEKINTKELISSISTYEYMFPPAHSRLPRPMVEERLVAIEEELYALNPRRKRNRILVRD